MDINQQRGSNRWQRIGWNLHQVHSSNQTYVCQLTKTMALGQQKNRITFVSWVWRNLYENLQYVALHCNIKLGTNIIWNYSLRHFMIFSSFASGVTFQIAFNEEKQHFASSIPNNTFDIFCFSTTLNHSASQSPVFYDCSPLDQMQQTFSILRAWAFLCHKWVCWFSGNICDTGKALSTDHTRPAQQK